MSVQADRIERFLRDNPVGPLWVTVGFASAFGLAWLNDRARGRPVTLLIGDTRTGFTNYSEADRRAAIAFVQRPMCLSAIGTASVAATERRMPRRGWSSPI